MRTGRPRKQPGELAVTIAVTIRPDLLAKVDARAKQLRRSRASVVGEALERWLESDSVPPIIDCQGRVVV